MGTKEVGVITPPRDIRTIIDKTVQFVTKNGNAFEKKILSLQEGNAKFNFLLHKNPYHLYYQAKLNEFKSISENNPETVLSVNKFIKHENLSPIENTIASTIDDYATKLSSETFEEPDDEVYTINIPPSISELEVDVIRLAAQ